MSRYFCRIVLQFVEKLHNLAIIWLNKTIKKNVVFNLTLDVVDFNSDESKTINNYLLNKSFVEIDEYFEIRIVWSV